MTGVPAMIVAIVVSGGCADSASTKSESKHQSDPYAIRWARLAKSSHELIATPEGSAYEHAFAATLNLSWHDIAAKCHEEIAKPVEAVLSAIAVIDPDGTITEILPEPGSSRFPCFEDEIIEIEYPRPPLSPFYETLHLHLRSPPKSK